MHFEQDLERGRHISHETKGGVCIFTLVNIELKIKKQNERQENCVVTNLGRGIKKLTAT